MATIAVLGAGIMASALSVPLTENGHRVRLVGTHLDREIIDQIRSTGIHPGLGIRLPQGVSAYQLEEAAEAFDGVEHVMSGVNSFGVTWAGAKLNHLIRPGTRIICLAKGMVADQDGNLSILPDVLAAELDPKLRSKVTISAIAGPSIAGEVAVRRHTSVVFTGLDETVLTEWRQMFATEFYHVWTSTDLIGVEVCAATKNCYAFGAGLMAGVLDDLNSSAAGQYQNFNFGAAIFGQAAVEMMQFMALCGGQQMTPIGLPGIGDCFVTSMGGRNVRCGRLVGAGMSFSQARATMQGVTLEGVAAIGVIGGALAKLTSRAVIKKTDFPLLRHLYEIVALDQPVNVPWNSFFGQDGSGGGPG